MCCHGSETRPGKILADINGRPLISYTIERVQRAATRLPLVIVISEDPADDPIADYCRRSGLVSYRVPREEDDKFSATIQRYNWDFAVKLNGEELFIDPNTLQNMLAVAETDHFDFISNVPEHTFPDGMSIEIIRSKFYFSIKSDIDNTQQCEQVFSLLYEKPNLGQRYIHKNKECPQASGLSLAIDTHSDIDRACNIIQGAGKNNHNFGLREIESFLRYEKKISPWQGAVGPLLIAEIGGNHEGDFEVAKHMTELAISSGADSVKFQLYSGSTLVSPVESPDRHRHFKKFELTKDQHIYLAKMCQTANVSYSASVWDLEMLDWIDPYLDFYKIGSGDVTAWPILEAFAHRGKPILLSTGLSTMEEILQTVSMLQRVNPCYTDPNMLCVMQCTSMYPTPDEDANLRVMDSLKYTTGLSIGYSDHTIGMEALLTATAMGADALEFHFTDTREGKSFRDHKVSLTPNEVLTLKEDIKRIKAFHGSGIKLPQPSELANGHEVSFRRGAYVKKPILTGDTIKKDDLVFLRPAHGTDARDSELLIGSKAVHDLIPFKAIELDKDYSKK